MQVIGNTLSATASGSGQPGKGKRIHDAAQQFESLMIGEMLKSVRENSSSGWMGSGDSTGDDSAMGMAEAQFANALTAGGGLGLSKMIERSLTSQNAPQNENASPSALPAISPK